MTSELEDAVESARSVGIDGKLLRTKHHSRAAVVAIVKHVLGELTDHLSIRDVLDELDEL